MTLPLTFSRRASGLLLHPTSLPGHYGSGDLGPAAYRFADFLAAAGQTWWQMLPVNPPGDDPGNSPYSSTSAFAGSPYLVSLELLADDGLLDRERDLRPPAPLNGHIIAQFETGFRFRMERLRTAFRAFERQFARSAARRRELARFRAAQRQWLDDWTLYAALRDAHRGAAWHTWEPDIRARKPDALRRARRELAGEIRFHEFVQFAFDRQWRALRDYCHNRGIGLIGDIPIFVAHDSVDVWARPELFLLDRAGQPLAGSGYPPDCFNCDGQTWGHPQYRWSAHRKERFAWWVQRFGQTLRLFDGARIDHFLGFHRTWHVPHGATHARDGRWVRTPGRALFDALLRALPDARERIIAEDLGQLTAEAIALRDRYGFPGMRVVQFGFGDGGGSYHLPHAHPRRCVAYTGTPDNDTIVGWFAELRGNATAGPRNRKAPAAREYRKVLHYLDRADARDIHWALIRACSAAHADTIIFPVQDILGLDARGRMNTPGTPDGNWRWRLRTGQLTDEHALKLHELGQLYDRLPPDGEQRPRRRKGAKADAKGGRKDGRIRFSGAGRVGSR